MINNCEYNMYRNNNNIPNYYSYDKYKSNNGYYQDDRFALAPFLVGGVAGTALGYGIANNNMYKGGYYPYQGPYYFSPYPVVPYYYR
ncbi:MAG: hypothetical protein IK997_00400 [Bacilli bacterium]|nr:hypothetical protein [Bacilli bacterium]